MKKSLSVLVAIALSLSLSAQEKKVANKMFFTEIGGPGLLMSANFDSRFTSQEQLGFGFRLGLGFAYGDFEEKAPNRWGYYEYVTRTYFSIPAGLNYVFGKANSPHTFEVGAGVSILTRKVSLFTYSYRDKPGNAIGFFTFMYRYLPENGGFAWRIGLTPTIGTSGNLFPMGAIGIGYVF